MNNTRLTLLSIVLIVGAFLGGLVIGTRGRAPAESARDQAELRLNVERARTAILHGRLELFSSNFGGASRQFDAARAPLEAARVELTESGRADATGRIDAALAALGEAQQMALALDRQADAKAVEALQGLEGI